MPYVRVRTKIRLPSRHRLTFNLRIFLVVAVFSIAAGFLATVIGNKANDAQSVNLETLAEQQKQKVVEGYKEKYGDNWKEKILADYKKNKQSSW